MDPKSQSHPSPALYWKIASAALADEQRIRLQEMRDIDGLLALNRLTMGRRATRADRFEKESDSLLMARLFAAAYGSRCGVAATHAGQIPTEK